MKPHMDKRKKDGAKIPIKQIAEQTGEAYHRIKRMVKNWKESGPTRNNKCSAETTAEVEQQIRQG